MSMIFCNNFGKTFLSRGKSGFSMMGNITCRKEQETCAKTNEKGRNRAVDDSSCSSIKSDF